MRWVLLPDLPASGNAPVTQVTAEVSNPGSHRLRTHAAFLRFRTRRRQRRRLRHVDPGIVGRRAPARQLIACGPKLRYVESVGVTSRIGRVLDAGLIIRLGPSGRSDYEPSREQAQSLREMPTNNRDTQRDDRKFTNVRILLIEDDKDVASFTRSGLEQNGYTVDHSADGKDGLYLATTEPYDALIVDRMLPGVDGLTIIRTLRASNRATPALILSALGEVDDRVKGLKAGGDDYLVKPFAFSELLARLEALLRRARTTDSEGEPTTLRAGDLEMDLLKRTVIRDNVPIDLHPTEFKLLEEMLRHQGQVVTRTMLLESVWGFHFDPKTNVIDVHISNLRSKIDRGFDTALLHTVRGVGYRLEYRP